MDAAPQERTDDAVGVGDHAGALGNRTCYLPDCATSTKTRTCLHDCPDNAYRAAPQRAREANAERQGVRLSARGESEEVHRTRCARFDRSSVWWLSRRSGDEPAPGKTPDARETGGPP